MTNEDRAWEATATHLELRAEFATKVPVPRRRFRVEGTGVGNSYLLTAKIADSTSKRYGGRIVEVIPLLPLAERQASGMPSCRFCEVAEGQPCKSSVGNVVVPHKVRWEQLNS